MAGEWWREEGWERRGEVFVEEGRRRNVVGWGGGSCGGDEERSWYCLDEESLRLLIIEPRRIGFLGSTQLQCGVA